MTIEFTASAGKHGIPAADALYAMTHPVATQEDPNGTGDRQTILAIGPAHAQTDRLLEVIATFTPGTVYVFHAMELGPKFRNLIE